MKRNIVILLGFSLIVLMLTSCAARTKCAAYGHYSYHETTATVEDETL